MFLKVLNFICIFYDIFSISLKISDYYVSNVDNTTLYTTNHLTTNHQLRLHVGSPTWTIDEIKLSHEIMNPHFRGINKAMQLSIPKIDSDKFY